MVRQEKAIFIIIELMVCMVEFPQKEVIDMIIEKADKKDLQNILEIQYMAFRKEAEEFNDFEIEPLKQTVEALEEEFQKFTFLKAVDENGNIIGSTRGYVENETSYVGKTFVHPDFQGKGIGTQLIKSLEYINKAPRYEISGSIRCPQNISLYEHLGFVRFNEITTENNGFIYLEKFV